MGRGAIGGFEDLEVWSLGRDLVVTVYAVTAEFPPSETYGLTSQIRRAAVSVPANVAEGFGRYHYGDRVRFFLHARGSLCEVKSHLLVAAALGILAANTVAEVTPRIDRLGIKLNNLIAASRTRAGRP